ncbi:MAG: zinc-binding dehydrogenase [Phycisphaerae bacterium]|nr:zinc-binding dehydrogenase [Phycisphaerae bacterium]
MKAAVIEKFGSIVVRQVPEPVPGDYDALCELLYGVTCTGTDTHIIDGVFPWTQPLPTVLGHESVGRVVAVGRKVRNYRPGDLVTRVGTTASADGKISVTWGGFAEMGIARDHWAMCADGLPPQEWTGSRWNQTLPAAVDPRHAPMFTTWREALSYITRMGVGAGSSVLIVGSGGNGLAYAVHAAMLGASCVAMIGSAAMAGPARAKAGVHSYFDYKRADLTEAVQKTHPDGFAYIIDAVGRMGVADAVLPCLAQGGTYGTYGLDDKGRISMNPERARGAFAVIPCSYDEAETHQRVSELYLQGRLKVDLWYDPERAYPLSEIAAAFADVRARRSPKALVRLKA